MRVHAAKLRRQDLSRRLRHNRASEWHAARARGASAVAVAPKGAKIRVALARWRVSNPRHGKDFRAPKHPAKQLRILLVEDHRDTRHTLSRLLTHFGHQISVAGDRQSALHIIASQNFDVILCDIGLPDGSGYEVISHAKRQHPVKAIAISGFGTEADVRRSTEAGFDFHLVKPLDLRELQEVLDQVVA